MDLIKRRKTPTVKVGPVLLGSRHPIAIQSMTDTPTSDIPATFHQAKELIDAGSELVRWTINDGQATQAVPELIQRLRDAGYATPIIGDFHYNGHRLLAQNPQAAKLLDKYRINPGNVGNAKQRDENFSTIVKIARDNDKPIRIGANSGSVDQKFLAGLMNKNAKSKRPKDHGEVLRDAMIESVLSSARQAISLGLKKDKIVLSVKMSHVNDTVAVYECLSRRCDFVLHLGLTEAGTDIQGITASSAALGILLKQGIGDTFRVSLTPQPQMRRTKEVEVAQALLQALDLRHFTPTVVSCPGCGRTNRNEFQALAQDITNSIKRRMPEWKKSFPGIERLTIAVMGCVVNGPGESREADVGISFPGAGEEPKAPVYVDGEKFTVLSGPGIAQAFIQILEDYLKKRFSGTGR